MARAVNLAVSPPRFALRPDLGISRWDDADDGGPKWLVHDPVSGIREHVEWPECLILQALRQPRTLEEIAAGMAAQTTLRPTSDDVGRYVLALAKRGWLRGVNAARDGGPAKASWWGWLVEHYIYMRIPLWNPDRFLDRTLGAVRFLARPLFVRLFFLLVVFGLFLALPRWEGIAADFRLLADWRRIVGLLPLLPCVKLVHEFAHAYAAKAGGARVGAMGVALIFLFPLPFVDVTDAWKLPRRRRLWVAAAGVSAEVAVGGVALLLWALAPPGAGRLACLMLATTALLSTLVTNLNPGVRFDGYFILANLMGVENLRPRAIGYLRRWWRRVFLGMRIPEPEEGMTAVKRFGLLFYAVYAWLYRVVLCFGIAVMVYRTFPKAVGLLLFAIEAWVFLVRPVVMEARALSGELGKMRPRAIVPLLILAVLGWWFVAEIPRRASLPAVARSGAQTMVRAMHAGEIRELLKSEGETIRVGEALAVVDSRDPLLEREQSLWSEEEARRVESASWVDPASRSGLSAARARSTARSSVVKAWEVRIGQDRVRSPGSGVVAVLAPGLEPGTFVPRGGVLGLVESDDDPHATALADVAVSERLEKGAEAWFYPDDGSEPIRGRVELVDPYRLNFVGDGILAGLVASTPERGGWRVDEAKLRVKVALDAAPARSGQTGKVWVRTRPYSLAADLWAWLKALAVRESGF